MVPIVALWQPIVVAALLVFFLSSLLHMVFTYHRSDYRQLPNESELLEGLRRAGLTPGLYFFPYSKDSQEMASPELQEKFRKGPVGSLTVMPSGAPAMPKLLALWFGFSLLVGFFVAYIAGRTVAPGAHYLTVFRVVGATAFMAYGVAHVADSIWKGQTWSATGKAVVDGLLYSLVTAGAFGWLWPR
jgi:hypothetical protein